MMVLSIEIMRNNIREVSERGPRLNALQGKTDNLYLSAQGFRRGANQVRKQIWIYVIFGTGPSNRYHCPD